MKMKFWIASLLFLVMFSLPAYCEIINQTWYNSWQVDDSGARWDYLPYERFDPSLGVLNSVDISFTISFSDVAAEYVRVRTDFFTSDYWFYVDEFFYNFDGIKSRTWTIDKDTTGGWYWVTYDDNPTSPCMFMTQGLNSWIDDPKFLGGAYYLEATTITYGAYAIDATTILTYNYTPNPVPIPAAIWLLGSGLIGLVGLRRKFKK